MSFNKLPENLFQSAAKDIKTKYMEEEYLDNQSTIKQEEKSSNPTANNPLENENIW